MTGFSWFTGIPMMEFFNETTGGDTRWGFPRILRIWITFPFDEVVEVTGAMQGQPGTFGFYEQGESTRLKIYST